MGVSRRHGRWVRSVPIACWLAAWLPLAAGATEPRFQTFGIADLSDSRAIAVSDDGCVLVGTGGPAAEPIHFRIEHGAIRPLEDLRASVSIGNVAGISGDGRVVVGWSDSANRGYRLEDGIVTLLRSIGYEHVPTRALAISGAGNVIAGNFLWPGPSPAIWRWDGISGKERPTPLQGVVAALSRPGNVAVGWIGSQASYWTNFTSFGLTPIRRDLGSLPGQLPSRALGVSADGTTIVGASGTHAFRWRGGVMEDLGPGVAVAASTDGSMVLGDSFLWDSEHGRRDLRAAIEADFGVDLSRWERVIGANLSPDRQTIVGAAAWPGQPLRAFRARRRPDACPIEAPAEGLPLLGPDDVSGSFDSLGPIAGAPDGTIYVGGVGEPRVIRTHVRDDPDESWSIEVIELPDPDAHALVVGAGVDGEGYVATDTESFLRIDADGTVTELLDGSVYPKPIVIQREEYGDDWREVEFEVPTRVYEIATAPDGTLFAAAGARALRIDPDGSATELFDLAEMQAWFDVPGDGYAGQPFWVQRFPDGRLVWGDTRRVAITDADGHLLEVLPWEAGRRFQVADEGGLWFIDNWWPLTYRHPDGGLEEFYPASSDGTGWNTWIHWFARGTDGSLFFVAEPDLPGSSPRQLVRWTTDEGVTLIHPAGLLTSIALAGDALLVTGRFVLMQFPIDPVPIACRNGRDDDGDALIDLADPGCSSAVDGSERAEDLPCDNGLDNDGDGFADLPDDPGCSSWTAPTEAPECDDGVDNDGDGRVDWNGRGVGAPDPQCGNDPSIASERASCGIGFELGLLALLARWMRRRNAVASA